MNFRSKEFKYWAYIGVQQDERGYFPKGGIKNGWVYKILEALVEKEQIFSFRFIDDEQVMIQA